MIIPTKIMKQIAIEDNCNMALLHISNEHSVCFSKTLQQGTRVQVVDVHLRILEFPDNFHVVTHLFVVSFLFVNIHMS